MENNKQIIYCFCELIFRAIAKQWKASVKNKNLTQNQ